IAWLVLTESGAARSAAARSLRPQNRYRHEDDDETDTDRDIVRCRALIVETAARARSTTVRLVALGLRRRRGVAMPLAPKRCSLSLCTTETMRLVATVAGLNVPPSAPRSASPQSADGYSSHPPPRSRPSRPRSLGSGIAPAPSHAESTPPASA